MDYRAVVSGYKPDVFKAELFKPWKCCRDEKARGKSKLMYFSEKLKILSSYEDTLHEIKILGFGQQNCPVQCSGAGGGRVSSAV